MNIRLRLNAILIVGMLACQQAQAESVGVFGLFQSDDTSAQAQFGNTVDCRC